MTLAALLILAAQAASPAGASERVSQPALLEAFHAFCLAGDAPSGTPAGPALAAGFHPVPVAPPSPGWIETGAWQRGGLRLFNLSANGDLPSSSLCGVSANIGPLGEDNDLLGPVARLTDAAFVGGNPGRPYSGWNIASRRGLVRASIDRSDEANVGVVLFIHPARR